MTKLQELGRTVAREQDLARAHQARDPLAAERFARRVSRPPRRWPVGARLSAVLMTAAAASVVVWISRVHSGAISSADPASPAVGEHFATQDGQKLPLSFPDGSQVVIGSGSAAVVEDLSPTGAKIEVSKGEASFAVRHQQRTNWLVGAGPYHVRVTGTRFSVSWMPAPDRFELRLEQGSVVVTTDTGSHAAVTMIAPQSLVIDHGAWTLGSQGQAALPAAPVLQPVPEADAASVAPSGSRRERVSSGARPAHAGNWESLSQTGRYGDAYAEAAQLGIARLADTRPSRALLALAEVCRFSGHPSEATQVLSRLRARFPGADDAATAAFQLGREADDATAATWFRRYLDERPNGSLAPEASGRLLEALTRSGDRRGAERAAADYLARYPDGGHAAFARRLLNR